MASHPAEEPRAVQGGAADKGEATASSSPGRHGKSSRARLGGGHRDLGVGLVAIVVCGLLWWQTTRFEKVPAALSQGIPASFFPRILLAAVVILSCIMIWRGWRAEREPKDPPTPLTLATAAAIIVGVVSIPVLGILPMLALTAVVLPVLWGERRPIPVAIYALALPFLIWCVFSQLLQLRFPTGLLGF